MKKKKFSLSSVLLGMIGITLIYCLVHYLPPFLADQKVKRERAQLTPNWNINYATGPNLYQWLAGSFVFVMKDTLTTEKSASGYSLLVIGDRLHFCSGFSALSIQGTNLHLGPYVGQAILVSNFTQNSEGSSIWIENALLDEAVNKKIDAYKRTCLEPFERFREALDPSSPTPSPPSAGPLQNFTSEDEAWIKTKAQDTPLQESGFASGWHLPEGIAVPQFQQAYLLTQETVFGFVQQRNLNTVLYNQDGSFWQGTSTFAGVIFSKDGGKTWKRAFTVPETVRTEKKHVVFNPVGMFWEQERYYLDIADDRGGGSGEGSLIRYWTTDGRHWQREGCYYFIPDFYYDRSYGQSSSRTPFGQLHPIVTPHQLKSLSCSSIEL